MSDEVNPSPLEHEQDAVLADYKKTRAFRNNPRAQEYLHMFFSPNRIPVGLTDNEVAICIRLYPYRKRMIKRLNEIKDAKLAELFKIHNIQPYPLPTLDDALYMVGKGYYDTVGEATEHLEYAWRMAETLRKHPLRLYILPKELSPSLVMTRERFRQGIRKVIAEYRETFKEEV